MKKGALSQAEQIKLISENGLGFVSRGIEQLWDSGDPDALKYSVIGFYTGVELLLKARLMHEHWSLIVPDVNRADIEDFQSGSAQTIGLEQAITRLKKVAGLEVPKAAKMAFDELRKHRNQMVHFYHAIDVTDANNKADREAVVREQCRAWFFLRRLLEDEWSAEFEVFQEKISAINFSMKRHNQYLHEVYVQIEPQLEKLKSTGVLIEICDACGFEAIALESDGVCTEQCQVCLANQFFVLVDCPADSCGKLTTLEIDSSDDWKCNHCNQAIELDYVLKEHTYEGKAGRDDDSAPAYCVECCVIPETAGTLDDGSERIFCFQCFSQHSELGICEWCNDPFTGNASNTFFSGCDRCEGRAGQLS